MHRSSNASLSSSRDAINLSFSAALLNRVGDLVNGNDASPPNESLADAAVDEAARADDDDNRPPPPADDDTAVDDAALADAAVDEAAQADDACADDDDRPPPPADDDTLPPRTADDGPAVPPLDSRIPIPENRLCCSPLRMRNVLPFVTFMVRC